VIRHLLRAGAALAALALALGTATAASASPAPLFAPPKGYYLALGDSIAYGFQTSKALAGLPPEAFNTGTPTCSRPSSPSCGHRSPPSTTPAPASRPPHSCCRVSGRHPGTRCTTTTPVPSWMRRCR
jgi:hypothetical protein